MTADPAAVERVKDDQKYARLPCPNKTFDEALFQISQDKFLDTLSDYSGLGRIPRGSPVHQAFARHMAVQFRVLVDREIQRLFETDNRVAGHQTWPGRRRKIVSMHHSVLRRRARDLVVQLEPDWRWRTRRSRVTGICVAVANVMNTTDWLPIVRSFWAAYNREYGDALASPPPVRRRRK